MGKEVTCQSGHGSMTWNDVDQAAEQLISRYVVRCVRVLLLVTCGYPFPHCCGWFPPYQCLLPHNSHA